MNATISATRPTNAGAAPVPDEMLTTHQAAVALGVTDRRIRAAIAAGRISAERVGAHSFLIPREEVERYRATPRHGGRPKGAAAPARPVHLDVLLPAADVVAALPRAEAGASLVSPTGNVAPHLIAFAAGLLAGRAARGAYPYREGAEVAIEQDGVRFRVYED